MRAVTPPATSERLDGTRIVRYLGGNPQSATYCGPKGLRWRKVSAGAGIVVDSRPPEQRWRCE